MLCYLPLVMSPRKRTATYAFSEMLEEPYPSLGVYFAGAFQNDIASKSFCCSERKLNPSVGLLSCSRKTGHREDVLTLSPWKCREMGHRRAK